MQPRTAAAADSPHDYEHVVELRALLRLGKLVVRERGDLGVVVEVAYREKQFAIAQNAAAAYTPSNAPSLRLFQKIGIDGPHLTSWRSSVFSKRSLYAIQLYLQFRLFEIKDEKKKLASSRANDDRLCIGELGFGRRDRARP